MCSARQGAQCARQPDWWRHVATDELPRRCRSDAARPPDQQRLCASCASVSGRHCARNAPAYTQSSEVQHITVSTPRISGVALSAETHQRSWSESAVGSGARLVAALPRPPQGSDA